METAITAIGAYNRRIEEARKIAESFPGKQAGRFATLPRITPFGDWDYFYIEDELKYEANDQGKIKPVSVPKGFVTDLASVPSVLWMAFPPTGRYAYAAVVHDYLYWTQKRNRSEADAILEDALRVLNVNSTTVTAFNLAVTRFGAPAWEANIKAKGAGEKRFLIRFPENPLTSWKNWKQEPNVFGD